MRHLSILFILLFGILPGLSTAQTPEFRTPEELANPNGAFADVNGVSIYYERAGEGSGPVVILIHGFGGSTFTWRGTLEPLAQAGFDAIALDLPPFGLSDKSVDIDYSRSGMADLVAGLMDVLDIPQASIVGHSMGGAVTAQFAVRHPERIDKLVFVAGGIFDEAAGGGSGSEEEGESPLGLISRINPRSPAAVTLLRALITPEFFVDTIRDAYYDPSMVDEATAEGYARLLLIEDAPAGFLAYVQAQESSPITLEDLAAEATMPTLILWGMEDTWVPLSMGQAMNEALIDTELITYPLTGHLPMEENPDPFNADLIAFLQNN